MMDVIIECPLGSKCEYIGDDKKIHRCMWYTKMVGTAQDGTVYDTWKCAMSWLPILMVENSAQGRGVAAAIESLRNETVKRQDMAMTLLAGNRDAQKIARS